MSNSIEAAPGPIQDSPAVPADPYSVIAGSALFDPRWYLSHYPDVKASGIDPVEHFLWRAAIEFRNPGPRFNTKWYMDRHPEVGTTGINPLVHFELHGKGSMHQFLESKFGATQVEVRTLMKKFLEVGDHRPALANDCNCEDVRPQWAEYFLRRGTDAYCEGRLAEALQHFKHCVQASPQCEAGYVLYRAVFTQLNSAALDSFNRSFEGASLIVAHVSCQARLERAQASAKTFRDASRRIRNLLVVAEPSLASDSFEFRPEEQLLVVPASDAYEALPIKMQKLLRFLGLADVNAPVLKVDDDFQCDNMHALSRDLDLVITKTPYGGTYVVSPGPFDGATFWHLGKCTDSSLNEQPDSLLFNSPYVIGKYYWLNGPAVTALSKMTLVHDKLFSTEIYEDRAVGALMNHYGYQAYQFDLVASRALANASSHHS